MLFFKANSESFLSSMPLPEIIVFLFKIEILEKFFPNLITTPSYKLSLNKTLDPAPITNILPLLLYSFKNSTRSFSVSGLK